ncbi:MAG TPA: metal ABC transporter permease [Gallionella sp.]|nr:metal ABC transporter permease [Gallionella sp.]
MTDFDFGILLLPFIAGLLVLATHIPLGMKVLARGVIFSDLAVAQIAGLGVIAAGLAGLSGEPVLVQLTAGASALCGAAVLSWIEQHLPDVKEAAIGLTFVLAASAGILLMSRDVHAGEHLKDLLVGQILWVGSSQVVATALLSAALLILWHTRQEQLGRLGFYVVFALAVTASVQLVGIYLVFASLIVPALATWRLGQRRMRYAWGVGIAGYAAGLLLSAWFDLPAGAAIVWAMAIAGITTTLLTKPQKEA